MEQRAFTYTDPTAPTSIIIKESVIKPSFSPIIYWSGAKAGTNNPIVGYKVYWEISDDGSKEPTTKSKFATYDSTGSNGYPFEIGNLANNRGKYLRFGVQTLGEYSNSGLKVSTKKVKINTLPEISISVSGTNLDNNGYVIGPIVSFNYKQGYEAGTISLRIKYGQKGEESAWKTKTLFENQPIEEKRYSDIRREIGAGVHYKFEVLRTDNLGEKSQWVSQETSYYTTFFPLPSSFDNIIQTSDRNYFKKKVGFYFTKDPGYNYIDVTVQREADTNVLTPVTRIFLTQKNNSWYGLWNDSLKEGEEYRFKIRSGYSTTGFVGSEVTLSKVFYRIQNLPTDVQINLGTDIINVYDPNGTSFAFTMRNFLKTAQFKGKEALQYGFANFNGSFSGHVEIEGIKGENLGFPIDSNSSDNNDLRFAILLSQNTALVPKSNINTNKVYDNASFVLKIKNSFGDVVTYSKGITVNYCQISEVENMSLGVWDNSTKTAITAWKYPLKETMIMKIDGSIIVYNSNPKIQIFANNTKLTDYFLLADDKNTQIEKNEVSGATKYIFSISFELGEIKSSGKKDLIAKIITDAQINYQTTFYLCKANDADAPEFLAHTTQSVQALFDQAKYHEEKLDFQLTNIALGAPQNGYLNVLVKIQTKKPEDKKFQTFGEQIEDLMYPPKGEKISFENAPFVKDFNILAVRLEITTIQTVTILNGGSYKTEKVFYSNELFVYNVSPTVAYRKNYLGINTTDFSKCGDSVVVISEYEGKQKICLISPSKPAYRTIDIVSGMIDGFIIDGGTW